MGTDNPARSRARAHIGRFMREMQGDPDTAGLVPMMQLQLAAFDPEQVSALLDVMTAAWSRAKDPPQEESTP